MRKYWTINYEWIIQRSPTDVINNCEAISRRGSPSLQAESHGDWHILSVIQSAIPHGKQPWICVWGAQLDSDEKVWPAEKA